MSLVVFDLHSDEDLAILSEYKYLGKLSGLLAAHTLSLPVSSRGFILSDPDISLDQVSNEVEFQRVICRPDAPIGKGNALPRGRDLPLDEVPDFLRELKGISESAVILGLSHPSIELCGCYIPRYKLSGAAMIIVDKENDIKVEYVGPGFDVGDISRGKAAHSTLVLPWSERYEKPFEIFRLANLGIKGRYYEISANHYRRTRKNRIDELKQNLKENNHHSIDEAIPKDYRSFSPTLFKLIYEKVISNSFESNDFGKLFGIMINIYPNSNLHVFEIWQPVRSGMIRKL